MWQRWGKYNCGSTELQVCVSFGWTESVEKRSTKLFRSRGGFMSRLLSFCTYGSFLSAVLIPESTEEAVWAAQVWSEQTQYYPCRFPPHSLCLLTATNTDFCYKGPCWLGESCTFFTFHAASVPWRLHACYDADFACHSNLDVNVIFEWLTGNSMCSLWPTGVYRWIKTCKIGTHCPRSFPGLQWWPISTSECMSLTVAHRAICISSLDYHAHLLLHSSPSHHQRFILLLQAHNEAISSERNERQRLERDLEEASRRLAMAHQDIRRLTNELDAVKNNNIEPVGMLQRVMFPKTYIEFTILLFLCLFKFVIVSRIHTVYMQPLSLVCPASCLQSSKCPIVKHFLISWTGFL